MMGLVGGIHYAYKFLEVKWSFQEQMEAGSYLKN